MANKDLCIFILITTILAQFNSVPAADFPLEPLQSSPSPCKEYVVGDDKGWNHNVDYKAWASGKEFYMGDKLVFNYKWAQHSVLKVKDEASITACSIGANEFVGTSGHEVVTLDAMGGIGFMSGIENDCDEGMKFFINVKCPHTRPKNVVLQGARKLVPPN